MKISQQLLQIISLYFPLTSPGNTLRSRHEYYHRPHDTWGNWCSQVYVIFKVTCYLNCSFFLPNCMRNQGRIWCPPWSNHSSFLAWTTPWTEEPGGPQYVGSQRVGHDWVTNTHWVSQVTLVEQNPPANAGDLRQLGSVPGSGRYPAGGHGNPL